MLLQQFRRPDTGELQQLRRIIRAAGDQYLLARPRRAQAAAVPVFDGPGATAFEQDALRQRRSLDVQIAAIPCRAKIGERRARSSAAPRRSLEESGAFLRRAVEIGICRDPALRRGGDKGFRQRIGVAPVRHRQRAADAVILVGAALLVLGSPEIGQHVFIAPAGIAALAPAIVILVLSANVQQAVDRTRAAEHLAARLKHLAPAQARFGLGLVHPVDGFLLEQLAVSERHVDPDVGVLWAGLEQQHRLLAVRAQTIGQHASRRSRADDDVVEFSDLGQSAPYFRFALFIQAWSKTG